MGDVLRCIDRFGRVVVLTNQRWHQHILIDHAEMRELLSAVEQCIEDPDQVNLDADFAERESFYRFSVAGSRGDRHVKVCIEYSGIDGSSAADGYVVTAYVTRAVKDGEAEKWRSKS